MPNRSSLSPTSILARAVKFLGSLELGAVILLYLFGLVLAGTLYQTGAGIYLAVERFFTPLVLTDLGLPLPGGQTAFWLLGINILVSMVCRLDRVRLWIHAGTQAGPGRGSRSRLSEDTRADSSTRVRGTDNQTAADRSLGPASSAAARSLGPASSAAARSRGPTDTRATAKSRATVKSRTPRLGMVLGHIGLVLLLLAAFVGYRGDGTWVLALAEGQSSSYAYFVDKWELVVWNTELEELARVPLKQGEFEVRQGDTVWGVTIDILHRNSERLGLAVIARPEAEEASANMPGARIQVRETDAQAPGGAGGADRSGAAASSTESTAAFGAVAAATENQQAFGATESPPSSSGPATSLWLHGADTGLAEAKDSAGRPRLLLGLEPARIRLPFEVHLDDFRATFYPGTSNPASFESDVRLLPQGLAGTITMNEPFRHDGWTIYQNSYSQPDPVRGLDRQVSIFSVQHQSRSWLPYAATLLAVFGFLVHVIQLAVRRSAPRSGTGRAVLPALALVAALSPLPLEAQPADAQTRQYLEDLVVMAGGRFMPLPVFASAVDSAFGNPAARAGIDSLALLAELVGTEDESIHLPLFRIENPSVLGAMNLPAAGPGWYSYADLAAGFRLLQQNSEVLAEWIRRFPDEPLWSELESLMDRGRIFLLLRAGLGTDADLPSQAAGSLLRLVPMLSEDSEVHGLGALHPAEVARLLETRQNLVAGDPELAKSLADHIASGSLPRSSAWYRHLAELQRAYFASVPGGAALLERADLELFEFRLPLGSVGTALLALALVAGLAAVLAGGAAGLPLAFRRSLGRGVGLAAPAILGVATFTLLAQLVFRVLVTQRPPVTDLASSFEFVALLLAGASFVASFVRAKPGGRRLAAINSAHVAASSAGQHSGPDANRSFRSPELTNQPRLLQFWPALAAVALVLQLVRPGLGGGDRNALLPAVLDANFWLAIHVPIVTAGYALVLVAAVLGNLYIIRTFKNPQSEFLLFQFYRTICRVLAVGCVTTFFGTMLGGFWADQAWGRFWGWDPKENGALLIVLWTAAALHLHLARRFSRLAIVTMTAASSLVLAFSWLGVNLMGRGLHSYGFSQNLVVPFVAVVAIQGSLLIFAAIAAARLRRVWRLPGERSARVLENRYAGAGTRRIILQEKLDPQTAASLIDRWQPGQNLVVATRAADAVRRRVYTVVTRQNLVGAGGRVQITWTLFLGPPRDPAPVRAGLRFRRQGAGVWLSGPVGSFTPAAAGGSGKQLLLLAQGIGIVSILPALEAGLGTRWLLVWCQPDVGGHPLLPALRDLAAQKLGAHGRMSQEAAGTIIVYSGGDAETRTASVADNTAPDGFAADSGAETRTASAADTMAPEPASSPIPDVDLRNRRFDKSELRSLSAGLELWAAVGSDEFLADYGTGFRWTERFVNRPPDIGDLVDTTVTIEPDGLDVEAAAGKSLAAVLEGAGRGPRIACGVGQCGSCACRVLGGAFRMEAGNVLGRQTARTGEVVLACVAYPTEPSRVGGALS